MFDLIPDDTQLTVADSARSVANSVGSAPIADYDTSAWSTVLDSMLFGLGIDETADGVGLGCAEESLAFEELGAQRATPALLASTLAAHLLAETGDADGVTLADVLGGSVRIGLADPDDRAGAGESWRTVEAGPSGLLLAVTADEVLLLRAGAGEQAVGFDRDATLGYVTNVEVIARASGVIRRRALVLTAAMLVGAARRSLETIVEHTSVREQFGKTLASFQAVRHELSDMAVAVEAATAAVRHAAVRIDHDGGDDLMAATTKSVAGTCALQVVRSAIQLFGGMGVTDEGHMHRYLRRVHLLENLFGSSEWHDEQVVRLVEVY